MIAVGIMIVTQFMMTRVTVCLDSSIAERQEIVRLSLLWSLRPGFIAIQTSPRTLELCGFVARSGREFLHIVMTGISALTIVPVLVLMFIRLPSYLFVLAI